MASSSTRNVARAARASARSASGQRRNIAFPLAIGLVVVLGVALVAFGRTQKQDADLVAPTLGDHWHLAYGVQLCGAWEPAYQDLISTGGHSIHTHGDGLIHLHPISSNATGNDARLGRFFEDVGLEVSNDRLTRPDGAPFVEGESDCDGEESIIRVAKWSSLIDLDNEDYDGPEIFTSNFDNIRFENPLELYSIVYGPEDAEIEPPPSVTELRGRADTIALLASFAAGESDGRDTVEGIDAGPIEVDGGDGVVTVTTPPADGADDTTDTTESTETSEEDSGGDG